jgi:Transcription factor IIIC subunit delta N-term
MWEEDIMVKKVWDIPNYSGCNKWSDDGMLAILTASSIQVLTPTFNREKFYHARWIHLEHIGENEGPGKKPKPASSKESYTVSTGDDLIHWMTEVNRCEDRTFGKLDVNSLYFIKAVWSPPGLVMCVPSYLSALLSDGSVLLLAMGGASQSNRQIYNNGRKSVSNLFSMTAVFDIGTLFDVWMEKNGAHVKGKSQTERRQKSKSAVNDSDSDSEEDNDDDSNSDKNPDDCGEEPQRDWKCMITEIASYPHLLSYRSPLGNRSTCMLLATGSSSGYINIWAIQGEHEGVASVQGKVLRAECVCSALLAEPANSSSYTAQQHSGHRILSVTCMEFMISSGKCSKNFETRLLCGSYGGFFVIFNITSDSVKSSKSKQTSSSSSSSSARFHSNGNTRGLPSLNIAQPVQILRPFNTPIESIVISSNEQNTLYLRSAARLVRVDLSTGTISRLENIHSHILSTIASIETRSYSEGGDLLATCSLDGDVKLWEQPSALCNDATHSNNNLNKTQKGNNSNNDNYINNSADENIVDMDDSILPYPGNGNKGVLVILDENRVKPLHAQNHDLKFFQLLEMNKCYAGHPMLDLTFDPLQLILVVTCLIPSTISDSREVQMNKNLEKAHCGISFFLSPILSPRWVVDCEKIEKVIRCAICPMTKYNRCGEFKSVKNGIVNDRSSNGNKNKNSHNININENENGGEKENGNYHYNNSEEYYLNRSSFCGLPFAWLRSFNEVIADLARGDPRTVPDVFTLEQLDRLGIVKEKKRVKGKKDKDDDDDGEAEDDSAPCRAGISDVAWRVKDLLYPNVDVLFHKSLHLVVDACVTISADLSSKDQGNDINVYDVNPVAGGNSHRQLLSVPTDGESTQRCMHSYHLT